MIEAIGALLAIIASLLTHFLREKPPEVKREEELSELDKALADADADTISRLFEQLRSQSSSYPRRPDDKTASEREL